MIQIALDGPSGAGKSTLARALAARLGFVYVDTGALYRTVALAVRRRGIDPADSDAVSACLPALQIALRFENGEQQVFLDGTRVGDAIRTSDVSACASKVSAIPAVRAFLLDLQRDIARQNNVVMDGRDIGTVILPHADVKFFVTVSDEERARRRHAELCARGETVSLDEVRRMMAQRDEQDRTRAVAPAVPAADAIPLDNSDSLEKTLDLACEIIRSRVVL